MIARSNFLRGLGLLCAFTSLAAAAATRPPNVVFILTDNQGAWTLGCYGNPDIRTPHIDRLAAEGFRFTRALSSNPVCSPTRATYLTGLIPSQHGVHRFLDQQYMMGPLAYNTLAEFTSIGEVLRDAGYVCGMTGKWHLGDNLRPNEGFSHWVTIPAGGAADPYDQNIIEDGKVRKLPGYLTEFWPRKAVEFIEQNRERPFFLFLPQTGPYVLATMMASRPRNRHAAYYRDKRFASFPVDSMHPWQYHNKQFHNQQVAMERTAAETSAVDDGVGEVMDALKRLGLDDNTLVVYAGDQGWMGGQNGFWGMGDHTDPIGAHNLMMQVPFIVRLPGRIPAGATNDTLVSNYDFMPTVLSLLGLGQRMPTQPRSPGRDLTGVLAGRPFTGRNEVFYEMETTRAINAGDWKYVARVKGPFELYDLKADPQERFNLFGQPGTEGKRAELAARLDAFFNEYADPKYNIWKGGGSKAKRHSN